MEGPTIRAEQGRISTAVPFRFRSRLLLSLLLLLQSPSGESQSIALKTLETNDLLLVNAAANDPAIASYAAKSYLNASTFHQRLFGWDPEEQVSFLFMDFQDEGNAAAGVVPRDMVTSQVSPPGKAFESFPPVDPLFALMNHEVAHLATLGYRGPSETTWRRIFSGMPAQSAEHPVTIAYAYLATPRTAMPRWTSEGIATFMDTWMTGGIGRAQGGFDEMVFRAMVRDGTPFYSNLGVASVGAVLDNNTGRNAYLYGTRFMSYLAYHYSPEKLIEWFRQDPGSKRYYADQFRQVFGKPLESVWQQWIEFEHTFQKQNLAAVREQPLTRGTPVVDAPLGWVSRMFVDEASNSLVGGLMYTGVVAHLGTISLDQGTEQNLHDIKGEVKYLVTSTAWDPDERRLFFTEDNVAWRDLRSLDMATGKVTDIATDTRIGNLAFNRADKSLWGVKHVGGNVILVGIPAPYERLVEVHKAPYGQVISDLDISPDGLYLSATVGDRQGNQRLQVFRISELVNGTFTPAAQFDFGRAFPENFVFSPDGKYLYGSSYYTGVSNIFRFDLMTGQMDAVTNAETGFFRPIPQADGSLIVFEYTGDGLKPLRLRNPQPLQDLSAISFLGNELVTRHPVVGTWGAGDPAKIDLESQITSREDYVPWRRLAHESSYPILEAYKEEAAVGYSFNWSDPVQLGSARLDLSYSPGDDVESDERLHVDARFRHMDWSLRYRHNDADFYDLFGPTERSRKGDSLVISYDHFMVYDTPRTLIFSADAGFFRDLDTLPANQNAEALIDELWSGNFGWDYSHKKRSTGAAVDEKGLRWELRSDVDYAQSELYPKLRGIFELGFALPWKHASVWLYSSAGAANGDRDDALTEFYFGGYGNNYVDNGSVKRYRDYDSMPGFEIGAISAKRFARSVLELNTPPIRFAEVGTPALYLGEIQPSIFAGILLGDPGSSREERYSTVGVQFDLSFTALHRLPMTISVGYARGFADRGDDSGEFMLSLKVL